MSYFPQNDRIWENTRNFLVAQSKPKQLITAPGEFVNTMPGVIAYPLLSSFRPASFDFAVVHKGQGSEIGRSNIRYWVENYQPVFANEVFVVFAKQSATGIDPLSNHYRSLIGQLDEIPEIAENINPASKDSDRSLDYGPVIEFIRANCEASALPVAPSAIRDLFESSIDEESLIYTSLDTVEYAILSVLSVAKFPMQDLQRIISDYEPIYSDNEFAIYAKNKNREMASADDGLARVLAVSIADDAFEQSLSLYRQLLLGS